MEELSLRCIILVVLAIALGLWVISLLIDFMVLRNELKPFFKHIRENGLLHKRRSGIMWCVSIHNDSGLLPLSGKNNAHKKSVSYYDKEEDAVKYMNSLIDWANYNGGQLITKTKNDVVFYFDDDVNKVLRVGYRRELMTDK